MTPVRPRIPPEFFDRARRLAAEERAKAMAAFFAGLGRLLHRLVRRRRAPRDVHFRFHCRGLWHGV
ncbi:MAG: hypothetical protein AB7R90_14805 [Reyranellaceae bacterium]